MLAISARLIAVQITVRKRAPETNAIRHHLIPESYIRRFAADGKRVYVFDRTTGKLRRDVPRNVAVEKDFNALTTRGGGKERWPESRLAELDGAVPSRLNRLESGKELTAEDRCCVAFFIGFANSRGTGFRHELAQGNAAVPVEPLEDLRFASAYAAMTGIWLDPPVLVNTATQEFSHIANGMEHLGPLVEAGMKLAMQLTKEKWMIVSAPHNYPFISGDRPVGLVREPRAFATDPFDPDSIKVFPLSPRHALFIRGVSIDAGLLRGSASRDLVKWANDAIARRADRYIFSSTEASLHEFAQAIGSP